MAVICKASKRPRTPNTCALALAGYQPPRSSAVSQTGAQRNYQTSSASHKPGSAPCAAQQTAKAHPKDIKYCSITTACLASSAGCSCQKQGCHHSLYALAAARHKSQPAAGGCSRLQQTYISQLPHTAQECHAASYTYVHAVPRRCRALHEHALSSALQGGPALCTGDNQTKEYPGEISNTKPIAADTLRMTPSRSSQHTA